MPVNFPLWTSPEVNFHLWFPALSDPLRVCLHSVEEFLIKTNQWTFKGSLGDVLLQYNLRGFFLCCFGCLYKLMNPFACCLNVVSLNKWLLVCMLFISLLFLENPPVLALIMCPESLGISHWGSSLDIFFWNTLSSRPSNARKNSLKVSGEQILARSSSWVFSLEWLAYRKCSLWRRFISTRVWVSGCSTRHIYSVRLLTETFNGGFYWIFYMAVMLP